MSFCPRVFRMRLLVIVGEYLAKEYVISLALCLFAAVIAALSGSVITREFDWRTLKKKKRNWARAERGRLLSGQQSSTSSRLLYDGLSSFLGSARSSALRPRIEIKNSH